MNSLLIGGPADGRRIKLPDDLRTLRTHKEAEAEGLAQAIYHEVFPNVTIPYRLWRHESITEAQALIMLFEGYGTGDLRHKVHSLLEQLKPWGNMADDHAARILTEAQEKIRSL